jgi:hypothetical protein
MKSLTLLKKMKHRKIKKISYKDIMKSRLITDFDNKIEEGEEVEIFDKS